MLLSYGRYRNGYVSGLSILVICFAALFFGEHPAQEQVTKAADQPQEEETSFAAEQPEFRQAHVETILISIIENSLRPNRRWIEIEGKLANQLWTHLRSARLSDSEMSQIYGGGVCGPQFGPPCYNAIVIFNDREKMNLAMTADISEVSVDSKEPWAPIILLRYDEGLATRIDQVFASAVE